MKVAVEHFVFRARGRRKGIKIKERMKEFKQEKRKLSRNLGERKTTGMEKKTKGGREREIEEGRESSK